MRNVSRTRMVLVLVGAFLGCAACTTLLSAYVTYRGVGPTSEPGKLFHPRVVQTPFTRLKGIEPAEFSAMTKLPIYPGAAAKELGLLGYSTPLLSSGNISDLTFMRFHTDGPPLSVDSWYQNHLGSSFVRSEGPLSVIAKDGDLRILQFAKDSEATAVLFRQDKVHYGDGVLVEGGGQGDELTITLIHYLH